MAAGLDNHNRKQAEESDSDILNCALRKNSVIMMWVMEFSGMVKCRECICIELSALTSEPSLNYGTINRNNFY